MRGGGLWLWENGGQVGYMVYGGGAGSFMRLAEGGGGSACVFLEQSREVLEGGGEKWCIWNVEMKLREKMLCWGSCGV